MNWREIGTESLKYAFTGLAGFGAGALIGHLNESPPFMTGGILSVGFVASRALSIFIRKKAIEHDIQLSSYQIVKHIAGTALKLATAVAFFACGILSTSGLMLMGGFSLAFCAVEIGIGLYIKYTEGDELMGDVVLDKKTPWHLGHAYA